MFIQVISCNLIFSGGYKTRFGSPQLVCRRQHDPGMRHPKEGPGRTGIGASLLSTLWKCLFQTFRSTLEILGAGPRERSCHCLPQWLNPRTWGTQEAWAVPDGSIGRISPLPARQSRFQTQVPLSGFCPGCCPCCWTKNSSLQGRNSPWSRGRDVAPSVPSEMFLGRKLSNKTPLQNWGDIWNRWSDLVAPLQRFSLFHFVIMSAIMQSSSVPVEVSP